MTTDVISNLTGSLDAELEQARATLREVDDGIKKLFGKENTAEGGSFGNNRSRSGRNSQDYGNEGHFDDRNRRRRADEFDESEPQDKRQRLDGSFLGKGSPMSIGPRMRARLGSEDDDLRGGSGRRLQSRIVTSSKEKSRDEVLAEQSKDKKGRDRNKRMFGALLGTLHRFKQEETKLKEKEDKRAQIEAKLDEAAKKERDEVRTKRQQLIRERKLRITEIKRLEIKRNRLADLAAWESKTKYLANFIRTESKPNIFYMPKKLNPITECRLEQSKQYVAELIANKRKLVLEDLEDYEERSKRYWERRLDGRETRRADPMDEDIEEELKEIMKTENLAGDDNVHEDMDTDADGDAELAAGEAVDFKVTVFTHDSSSLNTNNTSSSNINTTEFATNNGDDVTNSDQNPRHVESLDDSTIVVEVSTENMVKMNDDDDDNDGEDTEVGNNVDDDNGSHSSHDKDDDDDQKGQVEEDDNDNEDEDN